MWSAYKVDVPVKVTVTVDGGTIFVGRNRQPPGKINHKPGGKLPLPFMVTLHGITAAGPVPNSTADKPV